MTHEEFDDRPKPKMKKLSEKDIKQMALDISRVVRAYILPAETHITVKFQNNIIVENNVLLAGLQYVFESDLSGDKGDFYMREEDGNLISAQEIERLRAVNQSLQAELEELKKPKPPLQFAYSKCGTKLFCIQGDKLVDTIDLRSFPKDDETL